MLLIISRNEDRPELESKILAAAFRQSVERGDIDGSRLAHRELVGLLARKAQGRAADKDDQIEHVFASDLLPVDLESLSVEQVGRQAVAVKDKDEDDSAKDYENDASEKPDWVDMNPSPLLAQSTDDSEVDEEEEEPGSFYDLVLGGTEYSSGDARSRNEETDFSPPEQPWLDRAESSAAVPEEKRIDWSDVQEETEDLLAAQQPDFEDSVEEPVSEILREEPVPEILREEPVSEVLQEEPAPEVLREELVHEQESQETLIVAIQADTDSMRVTVEEEVAAEENAAKAVAAEAGAAEVLAKTQVHAAGSSEEAITHAERIPPVQEEDDEEDEHQQQQVTSSAKDLAQTEEIIEPAATELPTIKETIEPAGAPLMSTPADYLDFGPEQYYPSSPEIYANIDFGDAAGETALETESGGQILYQQAAETGAEASQPLESESALTDLVDQAQTELEFPHQTGTVLDTSSNEPTATGQTATSISAILSMRQAPQPDGPTYYRWIAGEATDPFFVLHICYLRAVKRLLARQFLSQKQQSLNIHEFKRHLKNMGVAFNILCDPRTRIDYDLRQIGLREPDYGNDLTIPQDAKLPEAGGKAKLALSELIILCRCFDADQILAIVNAARLLPEKRFWLYMAESGLLTDVELDSIKTGFHFICNGLISISQFEQIFQYVRSSQQPLLDTLLATGWIRLEDLQSFEESSELPEAPKFVEAKVATPESPPDRRVRKTPVKGMPNWVDLGSPEQAGDQQPADSQEPAADSQPPAYLPLDFANLAMAAQASLENVAETGLACEANLLTEIPQGLGAAICKARAEADPEYPQEDVPASLSEALSAAQQQADSERIEGGLYPAQPDYIQEALQEYPAQPDYIQDALQEYPAQPDYIQESLQEYPAQPDYIQESLQEYPALPDYIQESLDAAPLEGAGPQDAATLEEDESPQASADIEEYESIQDEAPIEENEPLEAVAHVEDNEPLEDVAHLEDSDPPEDVAHLEDNKPLEQVAYLEENKPLEEVAYLEEKKPLVEVPHLEEKKPLVEVPHLEEKKPLVEVVPLRENEPLRDAHLEENGPPEEGSAQLEDDT